MGSRNPEYMVRIISPRVPKRALRKPNPNPFVGGAHHRLAADPHRDRLVGALALRATCLGGGGGVLGGASVGVLRPSMLLRVSFLVPLFCFCSLDLLWFSFSF